MCGDARRDAAHLLLLLGSSRADGGERRFITFMEMFFLFLLLNLERRIAEFKPGLFDHRFLEAQAHKDVSVSPQSSLPLPPSLPLLVWRLEAGLPGLGVLLAVQQRLMAEKLPSGLVALHRALNAAQLRAEHSCEDLVSSRIDPPHDCLRGSTPAEEDNKNLSIMSVSLYNNIFNFMIFSLDNVMMREENVVCLLFTCA